MPTASKGPVSELSPPTFEEALSTFAGHVAIIMSYLPLECDVAKFTLGLGYGEGCPVVLADVEISPTGDDRDRWGVWAQVSVNGRSCGNRCGGRREFAKLFAPTLAWIANYWEGRSE